MSVYTSKNAELFYKAIEDVWCSEQYIIYLNDFQSTLRYKNMANDPSPEDARIAISRTKQIIQEFNANPKVTQFMDEAKEVHAKVLKANYEHKE